MTVFGGLPAEPEVFQRMAGPAYDNMQNQKMASHCLPSQTLRNLCLSTRE